MIMRMILILMMIFMIMMIVNCDHDDYVDIFTWGGRVKGVASSRACRGIVHVKAEQNTVSTYFGHNDDDGGCSRQKLRRR